MKYAVLLALLGFALAQNLSANEVVRYVQACDTRLFFYTPWMSSRAVAEALHQQVAKNNLPLLVASSSQGLFARSGIGLMGLGWAGAKLFKVSTKEQAGVLLCQGRYGVVGRLSDHPESPLGYSPTRLIQDPAGVNRLTAWFKDLLRRAPEVDAGATWQLMLRR